MLGVGRVLLLCLLGTVCAQSDVKFIILGDWGTGGTDQENIAAAMATWAEQNNPRFILTTGDNFYPDGLEATDGVVDDPRVDLYWKNMYNQPSLANLEWRTVVGNHDYLPYPIPQEDPGREWNQITLGQQEPRWIFPSLYWKFSIPANESTAGAIDFIMTDTQGLRKRKNGYLEQREWIEQSTADSTASWKFIVGHHPAYSSGRYSGSGTVVDYVTDPASRNNFDFYFCGHDHNMQFLNTTDPGSSDVEHIHSGGGGRTLYARNPANDAAIEAQGVENVFFEEDHGFVGVTVSASGIRFDYINEDGAIRFSVTRTRSRSQLASEYKPNRAARYSRHGWH